MRPAALTVMEAVAINLNPACDITLDATTTVPLEPTVSVRNISSLPRNAVSNWV